MGLHYKMPLRIPTLLDMQSKIGQGAWENPSVFSFFPPEFSPPGAIEYSGLVAPEAMSLEKSDNILFLLDSYLSTIKFGIVDCYSMYSFEGWKHHYPFVCPTEEGDTSLSPARISYEPQSIDSVDSIIDELDLLLTSGRLQGSTNRALIKNIIGPIMGTDVAKAVRAAQQLVVSTPEYHSNNLARKNESWRQKTASTTTSKAPYRAVIVLVLFGGVDSWNMLVPTGQCSSVSDQYEEYATTRGTHAIPKSDILPIISVGSNQTCSEYGVNKNLPILAELYNDNDAIIFANTGVLAKPMTKHDDWEGKSGFRPFAHNTMQKTFLTCDTYGNTPGTGVLGRILDVVQSKGLKTSANNVNGGATMLSGDISLGNQVNTISTIPPDTTSSTNALNKYPTVDNLLDHIKELNGKGEIDNSMLTEVWSSRVSSALFEHEQMQIIASIPEFVVSNYPVTSESALTSSFKSIAGYMKSHEYRNVNREAFVLSQTGFDAHRRNNLSKKLNVVNDALSAFVDWLKSESLWESTVIVQGSEFGRSLNPNSNNGSDHAW